MNELFCGAFSKVSVKFDLGRWYYIVFEKKNLFVPRKFWTVTAKNNFKNVLFFSFDVRDVKEDFKIFKVKGVMKINKIIHV